MGFFDALKSAAARGNDPVFAFNSMMYEIRNQFEAIEQYCGGQNWGGFDYLLQVTVPENALHTNAFPDPNSLLAIHDELQGGALYRNVLSGYPGVLAQVDIETLNYFRIAVGDAVSRYAYNLKGIVDPLGWSGYKHEGVDWTQD